MDRLKINLFAGVQVTLDGQAVTGFESALVRGLLAYLAVENARPHTRDQLAGLLWPEQEEAKAHQRLSQALYNLRQLLGEQRKGVGSIMPGERSQDQPFLLVFQDRVQFNPQSDYWLDIQAFTELLKPENGHSRCRKESCPECAQHLADAIRLYHGDFLEGLSLHGAHAFEDWVLVWRERLRLQAITALRNLTEYYAGRGEIELALDCARRQVAMDPLGDSSHRELMRLLAMNTEVTAALVLYSNFRRRMKKEMGLAPEHATQALYDRLHLEASSGVVAGNLPAPITPLIGRRNALAEVTAMLRDPEFRLISVIGPGGSGKTRLALEAGNAVRYHFIHGVYFVSLSALESSQSIIPVVAEAVGFTFRDQGEPNQQLLDFFRNKNLLLLMDSFETILGSAPWLCDVLHVAAQVKFLVTSRARLNVKEEQLLPLAGLDYPVNKDVGNASSFEAIQLFEQSARRVKPDFTLQLKYIPEVIKICRLVQGMPLGILLASAWIELFSLEEITSEIEKSLDFLSTTWSDMPERQRSLKATFNYSWQLLSSAEQRFLKSLAVFHGSFSMQAAKSVCGAPLRLLQPLVDNSLVNRLPNNRYMMHNLVRQFAVEQLEKDVEYAIQVHTQHSRFYLEALAEWGKQLKSAQQREALEAMEPDVENLRIAWRWAVETQDWSRLSNGLDGMGWYADLRFRFMEGERACRTALEKIPVESYVQLTSTLTIWRAHFLRRLVQMESAWQLLETELGQLERVQELGSDIRQERAQALFELGELNLHANREKARDYYQQSLEVFQEMGDNENIGKVLLRLGEVVHHMGDYAMAGQLLTQALPLLQAAAEPRRLASDLRWLGFTEIRLGGIDQGESYIRQAIEIRKQIGDLSEAAQSQDDYATVLAWRGRYKDAIELYEQCLPLYEECGMHAKVAWILAILGMIQNFINQFDQARQTGLRCVQFASEMNYPRELALGYSSLGQADLGEGKFAHARENFLQALALERRISQSDEIAFVLGLLALVELGLDEIKQACQYLCEALEIYRKTHGMFSANICLPASAVMLARMGKVEKAIEVQTLMLRFPAVGNAPWYEHICWRYIPVASLPAGIAQIAQDRGKQSELITTAEELLKEFNRYSKTINSIRKVH